MIYVVSGHKISDNSRYLCLIMNPIATNSVFITLFKASLKSVIALLSVKPEPLNLPFPEIIEIFLMHDKNQLRC